MKKVYSIQALNERASRKHQLNEKSTDRKKKVLDRMMDLWYSNWVAAERSAQNTRWIEKRVWKNFLTKWNACVKLIKLLLQNSDDIKRKVLIRNEKKVLDKLESLMYNKKAHINERNIVPCKLNNVTWTNYKPEILLKFILRKRTGRCKTGIKITASQHIAEIFDYNEFARNNTIF